jgi:acyl-CoA hydrolase
MLCDSMVDLYEAGVITGSRKKLMPRKWVASFAFGTNRLYDFIADNPLVEMHDSEFVNDPYNIGLNDNVVSINSTLEVDLTGQCASDAIGNRQYSGAGGQMDFMEGAWRSKGGQAFLAMYSTFETKDGELRSRIVPSLQANAMVTTTRNDVQYIVTEYGVAWLKGFNLKQRAEALIKVAHPDFRDWLEFEARKLHYLR